MSGLRRRLVDRLGPLVYGSDTVTRHWNELRLHHVDRWTRTVREDKFAWLAELDLEPGVLLDVGANYGQSALAMRHHRPDRSVVCVEANPDLHPVLSRLARRDPMISVVVTAAGDDWGVADLTIPTFHGSANAGGATLDPEFLAERTGELEDRYGTTMRAVTRRVPVMPLRALGLDLAAVKIDVEGLEAPVLCGLGLAESSGPRPPVMLEVRHSDGAAMRLLDGWGYRLHALGPGGTIGAEVSVDAAIEDELVDVLALPPRTQTR